MKHLIFVDTETTSNVNGRAIEVATSVCRWNGEFHELDESVNVIRCAAPEPITIEAMAIHHITPNDLLDETPLIYHREYSDLRDRIEQGILVAHHAPFDIAVLERDGIRAKDFIDTKRLARHLLPEIKTHSLQYLRYYLELYKIDGDTTPHTAAGDVRVLMAVFRRLSQMLAERENFALDGTAWIDRAMELSKEPVLITYVPFGKYEGVPFSEVNRKHRDFIKWMHQKIDRWDPDTQHTVRYWINRISI